MRKLNFDDLMNAIVLVDSSDAKKKLIASVNEMTKGDKVDLNAFGISNVFAIISALAQGKTRKEFYRFLSGPFECRPEEVSKWTVAEIIDNLKMLAKENDLMAFFRKRQI